MSSAGREIDRQISALFERHHDRFVCMSHELSWARVDLRAEVDRVLAEDTTETGDTR
jgi:hypothetical protein